MSVSESEKECPLCMEALDWDDLGFFPCSCGYQICRFCWHRLRTDENGLCPACRQAFPDIPVSFNPEISAEELKKQKKRNKERRSNKDQVFKPQDLATLRVVQKNLVFVIGLSSRLTQEDLKKEFAHFGKIIKFVHNKSTAYITYSKPEEAIRAIRTLNASAAHESVVQHLQFQSQLTNGTSVTSATTIPLQAPTNLTTTFNISNSVISNNNAVGSLNNHLSTTTATTNSSSSFINTMSVPVPPNRLKASLGTTKYCNHFLRSQQCPKVGECMYLHEIAEAEASFTKEQMQAGKHVEYEKKLMDSYLAKLETTGQYTNLVMAQQQQPSSHSRQLQLQSQPLQQTPLPPPPPPPPSSQPNSQLQPPQQTQPPPPPPIPQIQQQYQSPPTQIPTSTAPQQQLLHQPQQSLGIDTDSEDDGLDFDPISVSTRGLRDLLDQQVQQAKQLQMQNYFQQLNSNQALTNVLFQQNRLNHHSTGTNGLINDATFNGHPQSLPTLAGLTNNTTNQQQQAVTWQSLSAWTNFLQRSGYGYENDR